MIALTKSRALAAAFLATALALSDPLAAQDAETLSALDVLARRCAQCHGAAKMAGLDLRSRAGMLAGGGRGP